MALENITSSTANIYNVNTSGSAYGYNKNEVEELRNVINNSAQNASQEIVNILKREFVDEVAKMWFSPKAKSYFESIKSWVAGEGENLRLLFDGFRNNVEISGKNWAQTTGGEEPFLPALDDVILDLNIGTIQSDDNGSQYIVEDEINRIVGMLPVVRDNIVTSMTRISNDLKVASAFIGGGQSSVIEGLFTSVLSCVDRLFALLTEGKDGVLSVKDALTAFCEEYKATAEFNKREAERIAANPTNN